MFAARSTHVEQNLKELLERMAMRSKLTCIFQPDEMNVQIFIYFINGNLYQLHPD